MRDTLILYIIINKINDRVLTKWPLYAINNLDDCEDCVRERRENQIWINIYERMQILRDKVGKINAKVKDYQ